MMKKKFYLIVIGSLILAGLFLNFHTRFLRHMADDVLYDNYNHYLPCVDLPHKDEIEQTLAEHADVIDQIRSVSPDADISIDDTICHASSHADLIISYASHSQRVIIEDIVGGKTFFGIPVRWRNW